MQPFAYMELAKLRSGELQRQAEARNLVHGLNPAVVRVQRKRLDGLWKTLAAWATRPPRDQRPQPLGGDTWRTAA